MIPSRNDWNCSTYADDSCVLYTRMNGTVNNGGGSYCVTHKVYAAPVIHTFSLGGYVYTALTTCFLSEVVTYTVCRTVFFRQHRRMLSFLRVLKSFLPGKRHETAGESAACS